MVHISFWFILSIVNIFGGSVDTEKEKESLVVASKENGL